MVEYIIILLIVFMVTFGVIVFWNDGGGSFLFIPTEEARARIFRKLRK